MEPELSALDPRVLAKLQGLRLRAQQIVEGYVAGLHRSPFRGFSIEFAEHREYTPGDDLRYLDWKVFGRSDKYYVKQYEDETNLICYLVMDVSESMSYRSPEAALSKWEYAQCVAAALAYLVIMQQDAVSLATFDDQVQKFVRPGSGPAHFRQIMTILDGAPSVAMTATGKSFHELAERFTKRGLVIIVSDFLDDADSMLAGLKHFRYRRHDVALLHLLDPWEVDFPFRGSTMFRGLEQYQPLLADPAVVRAAYLAELERFLHTMKAGTERMGMDYRRLLTNQPFDTALSTFLTQRAGRTG